MFRILFLGGIPLFLASCGIIIDGRSHLNSSKGPTFGLDGNGVELPILVMPQKRADFTSSNYTVTRNIKVPASDVNKIDRLYIQGHGLAYRDGHSPIDSKGSVQLNSGPWVPLSNAEIDLNRADELWGGIGGGYRTVHGTISIQRLGGLRANGNTLRFRFNGTDGTTSGYRIVDINFLGQQNYALFSAASKNRDNPENWAAPQGNVQAGKNLWNRRNLLKTNPIEDKPVIASCADCHARDGFDLEYFAFSDRSIIGRSVFHGLTAKQGRNIAAYIRSHESKRWGRPWQPPYQPGPDIDRRPNAQDRWAGGAGLQAVLETENSGLAKTLFKSNGNPSSAEIYTAVKAANMPQKTINLRTIKIANQFPDWNSWLPAVHPLDVWGEGFFEQGTTVPGCKAMPAPGQYLAAIHKKFPGNPSPQQMRDQLRDLMFKTRAFVGAGKTKPGEKTDWRNVLDDKGNPKITECSPHHTNRRINKQVSMELAKRGLAQWVAVKYFEVVHAYGLHKRGKELSKGTGLTAHVEYMSWPTNGAHATHQIAPHIVANNFMNFESEDLAQSKLKGLYESSIWYHLNLVLVPPARKQAGVAPVDWPYNLNHIAYASNEARKINTKLFQPSDWQPLRFVMTYMKSLQMRSTETADSGGWAVRYVGPRWMALYPMMMESLNTISPNLQRNTTQGLLRFYVQKSNTLDHDLWIPCSDTGSRWYCIPDEVATPPKPIPTETLNKGTASRNTSTNIFPGINALDDMYRLFPILKDLGVSKGVRNNFRQFCKDRWPDAAEYWDNAENQMN